MLSKENKWLLIVILLINAVLALYPAIRFDLPVTQTDGATYYTFSRLFVENGINSENPTYNQIGALEKRISEYPPLVIVVFGSLIKYFGNDLFWVNGGYGAIFFLIATVFVYLLFKELNGNYWIGLFGALFSIFNVRAYYTLFAGQTPFFTAVCLTFPALFFTLKYFRENKIYHLVTAIIISALTYLSYTPQAFFLTILQIGLAVGFCLKQKLKLDLPKIKIVWLYKDLNKKMLYFFVPLFILAGILTKIYLFATSGRQGFVQQILSGLMTSGYGYQAVWGYILIMDNPIIVTLAIAGLFYLLYKQEWEILALVLAGLSIVLINIFAIPDVFAKYFFYRFYVTFFVLILIPTSIIFVNGLKNRHTRVFFVVLLILSLLIQIAGIGFFYSKIGPAISADERDAALFLAQNPSASVLYVNNVPEEGLFRASKWIFVYARSENFDTSDKIPEKINQKYIFIADYSKLSVGETEKTDLLKTVFSSGNVVIKEN